MDYSCVSLPAPSGFYCHTQARPGARDCCSRLCARHRTERDVADPPMKWTGSDVSFANSAHAVSLTMRCVCVDGSWGLLCLVNVSNTRGVVISSRSTASRSTVRCRLSTEISDFTRLGVEGLPLRTPLSPVRVLPRSRSDFPLIYHFTSYFSKVFQKRKVLQFLYFFIITLKRDHTTHSPR